MKSAEIIRILKKDGWYEYSQKGSHLQLKHPVKGGKVTVPMHGSKDIRDGTLHNLETGRAKIEWLNFLSEQNVIELWKKYC